jgi:hypothetical protein
MYPMCGGYWVKRANHSWTRCANGQYQEECYVYDIDWSDSSLSDQQISELNDSPGGFVLRGNLGISHFEEMDTSFNKLSVSEAWISATYRDISELPRGSFVRLSDNGTRCITTPCPSVDQGFLNTRLSFPIDAIDLSPSQAAEKQIADGTAAIFDRKMGLLAYGTNDTYRDKSTVALRFSAVDFYLRMTPNPCMRTGCSGEICSNESQPSPCVALVEYTCIEQQICEIQPNGVCGWTPTDESKACFDSLQSSGNN